MVSRVSLSLAFGILGLIGPRLPAQTNVGGLICTSTTWDVGGSPYIVTESIIVGCDAILTVDPGVIVRFNAGRGVVVGSSLGLGALVARGTSASKIVFQSNLEPQQPGDWSGIRFTDLAVDAEFDVDDVYQSGSILEHVIIEFAGAALPAVLVESSRPYLTHCEIRDSADGGISIDGTGAPGQLVEECEIHHSGGTGIQLTGGSDHRLLRNHVHHCGLGGIRLTGGSRHLLRGNNVHHCSAALGAGVYINAETTLDGNTVDSNSSSGLCARCEGGGVFFDSSSDGSTLMGNTITGNSTQSGASLFIKVNGGGVFFNASAGCTLTANTIAGNTTTGSGGGVFFSSSPDSTLTGNTITANTCGGDGGGIVFVASGNSALSDNEITGNHTTSGQTGGISVLGSPNISFVGDQDLGILNRIYGNDGYALQNANAFDGTGINDIDASYVWWGTCNIDAIDEQVFDFFDSFPNAFVRFLPVVEAGGDSEFDGDVDLDDFAVFATGCLTGPCGPDCPSPPTGECGVFDIDCDGDADLRDFAEFAKLFTGTPK